MKQWSGSLTSLRYPHYRNLLIGSVFRSFGAMSAKAASAWLIYDLSLSGVLLGLQGFLFGVAMAIGMPVGGTLSDKFDRRKVLLGTLYSAAAFHFLLLLIISAGQLKAWHLVVFAFIQGAHVSFWIPSQKAIMPSLVGVDNLANAIALNAIQFEIARALGPVIGGLLLTKGGAFLCYAASTASIFPLILAIYLMPSQRKRNLDVGLHPAASDDMATDMMAVENEPGSSGEGGAADDSGIQTGPGDNAKGAKGATPTTARTAGRRSIGAMMIDGVRFMREKRLRGLSALLLLTSGFCLSPIMSLLPALSRELFGASALKFSILLGGFGAGALIGAIYMTGIGKDALKPRLAFMAQIVFCVAILLMGVIRLYPVLLLLTLTSGITFMLTVLRLETYLLMDAPDNQRGRVSSLTFMCLFVPTPIGSLMAGSLSDLFSPELGFFLFGVFTLAAALYLSFLAFRREPAQQG